MRTCERGQQSLFNGFWSATWHTQALTSISCPSSSQLHASPIGASASDSVSVYNSPSIAMPLIRARLDSPAIANHTVRTTEYRENGSFPLSAGADFTVTTHARAYWQLNCFDLSKFLMVAHCAFTHLQLACCRYF